MIPVLSDSNFLTAMLLRDSYRMGIFQIYNLKSTEFGTIS